MGLENTGGDPNHLNRGGDSVSRQTHTKLKYSFDALFATCIGLACVLIVLLLGGENLGADTRHGKLVEWLQKQLTTGWRGALGPAREFVAANNAPNATLAEPGIRTGF